MAASPASPDASAAPPQPKAPSGLHHLLSVVGHFFKEIAVYVSDAFVALFGKDAAHTFAVGAEGVLKSALGQIALNAVQQAAAAAQGQEARGLAFQKIVEGARASGINAKDSLINMLLELALQRVKGSFGPA